MIQRKLMLLGEIGVGKTSIVNRLVLGRFEADYKATLGTDVHVYEVEPGPGGQPFAFIIWDTDGNFGDTIFRSVYIRQAHAAIIIGDATRRATLEAMARLADGFVDALPGRYLNCVVNKIDLLEEGQPLDLPARVQQAGYPLVRTSAKTGFNVKDTFHEAAATIARRDF